MQILIILTSWSDALFWHQLLFVSMLIWSSTTCLIAVRVATPIMHTGNEQRGSSIDFLFIVCLCLSIYIIITSSVSNYKTVDFFIPNLTTRLIKKIYSNLSYSWRTFINKASVLLKEVIFCTNFLIKRVVKFDVKKESNVL